MSVEAVQVPRSRCVPELEVEHRPEGMAEDMAPTTYFEPPAKEEPAVLATQEDALLADALVGQLLDAIPEPTVVLNAKRQIIRANAQARGLLGATRDGLFGLRLGEAIGCPHSHEKPAGCGTTPACRYCGAAQAIARSMRTHAADVRECHVESRLTGEPVALDLLVTATPFDCQGEAFTVCVLRDITDEKRRQVLQRVFFHDVLNSAGALQAILEIRDLIRGDGEAAVNQAVRNLAGQVVEEIQSQRDLLAAEAGQLEVAPTDVEIPQLLDRLCTRYRGYAIAQDKGLVVAPVPGLPTLRTDEVLLERVLGNLIKNALEASEPGQTVSVAFEHRRHPLFSVHNPRVMPQAVQLQMFHRSFTTRGGCDSGRGIGTYSARLLTEKYLKGDVSFISREPDGTTFFVALPAAI
jgi:PAS domain-containing protein